VQVSRTVCVYFNSPRGTFGHVTADERAYGTGSRQRLARSCSRLKPLEIPECTFANLPEKKAGRWGAGLTATKMAECRWLKPLLVGQFEFVEWTEDCHLRHSRFMGLREDKKTKDVRREV
jgi:bifunctional non-homologous end joining protein LigD